MGCLIVGKVIDTSLSWLLALAQQVFFVVTFFWPITLLLVAAWVWAFVATKPAPGRGR